MANSLTKIDDRGLKTPIDLLDSEKIRFGTGNDFELYHNGSNSYLTNSTGYLFIQSDDFSIGAKSVGENILVANANDGVDLYYDSSKKLETTSGGVKVTGNCELNSSTSGIIWPEDPGTNASRQWEFRADQGAYGQFGLKYGAASGDTPDDTAIEANANGNVELYYDNSKKFESTSAGGTLTGHLTVTGEIIGSDDIGLPDNAKINLGTGADLKLYHDGTSNLIRNVGSTDMYINLNTTEVAAKFTANGNVELYYDNSKKAYTASWGFQVDGNLAPEGDDNHSLGKSNEKWTIVYATNGTISTSDRNEKNTIVESDLGLDFVNKLKPVSYKWNKNDGKTHYGLIAQDIEETLTTEGKTDKDFAALDIPTEGPMGLNYSELISPLIKAVQELSAEVEALKAK